MAIRINTRDAVRYILAHMDTYYTLVPFLALERAFRNVSKLSKEDIVRLRKRQFGTLPNQQGEALQFLKRKFREHKENYDLLAEEEIESFTDTSSESSSSSSDFDFSSSDSDRTVAIDLRRTT